MEHTDNLAHFQQMLLDCYGIWTTRLDSNMQILQTNCQDSMLHKILLLTDERKEAIRSHSAASSMPLILSNDLGLVWSILFRPVSDGGTLPCEVLVLGPVYTGNIGKSALERLVEPRNLPLSQKWLLIDCLNRVPLLSHIMLSQHTIMLQYYFTGSVITVSDLQYDNTARQQPSRSVPAETPFPKAHAPALIDKLLLDMVRHGDLNYHNALSFATSASPGIRTRTGDPIRQAQYSVVAFITLCTRAAIEGGLSSDVAYSLCDYYTENLDNCKTFSDVAAVSHAMYDDFIHRVHRCRSESGLSRAVQNCCDYIDLHANEPLSAETLADKAGYTPYYFSRMFKQQTGKTLKEYIREARFARAKLLLSDTNTSIQDIAEALHFCSPSYFTAQFQKSVGISPAEYREQNRTL